MRVGIDARLWNETGVGRYIRALFNYLPKNQEFVWFLGKREFETLAMPTPRWKKVLATPHWHTLTEQIVMPVLFYRENLDLLHVPYVNFPLFYFKKTVSTIHDLILDHYKTGRATTLPWWFYLIKKFSYHFLVWAATVRAQKILTLSNDSKNEIISHYGTNPNKIEVIYEAGTLENA
jgi:glycosyltransferase involved in cell wall biosynthesis